MEDLSKRVLEKKPTKAYVDEKLAKLDALIENAPDEQTEAAYINYRDFWIGQLSTRAVASRKKEKEEIIEKEIEEPPSHPDHPLPSPFPEELEEDIIEEVIENPITEKIEETQVETIKEIKKAIDEDHSDIVVGNKIRCPECLGIYTKGAGFAAHYRSQHEEVKDDSSKPEDSINS